MDVKDYTQFSIQKQLLRNIGKRFRAGLVCKARRLLYNSSLGSRVIKKKKTHLRAVRQIEHCFEGESQAVLLLRVEG